MNKTIRFLPTFANVIGAATKARVRVKDGQVQVRFTDRTSLVNLPKDEKVEVLVKSVDGAVLTFPESMTEALPEKGELITLIATKYGWHNLLVKEAGDEVEIAGHVAFEWAQA